MEQPLPALVFQIFGFAISILPFLAESYSRNLLSQLPPSLPSPPVSYNRLRPPDPLPRPPYHRLRPPPPPEDGRRKKLPPPPPEKTMNTGKKIGLLFVVIAAILQIGVVVFLAFKRRQLLKLTDGYETSS